METKAEIRKQVIRERDALSADLWKAKSSIIEKSVITSSFYRDCKKLFIYADFHGEVCTLSIIEDALMNSKEVYLPKVMEGFNESCMEFYQIFSTCELVEGYKGIQEPMGNIDRRYIYNPNDKDCVILIPGVAFDKDGNRLGYGKGYYDNYLKDKPSFKKVGVCFKLQVMDYLPVEECDVRMDLLITEETSYDQINQPG